MKTENRKFKNKKDLLREAKRSGGFGLVEAIVAVSIAAFSIVIIWKTYTTFVKISLSNPTFFQASFLAEEGVEAVKFMRDSNWSGNIAGLSPGAPYSLVFDGLVWRATTTLALIDDRFDRRVVFSDVNRDITGNISSSGSPDPGTKKVVVTVSWLKDSATSTKEITTYVSNIFNN